MRNLSLVCVVASGILVAGCVVNLPAPANAPAQKAPTLVSQPQPDPAPASAPSGKRDVEAGPIWSQADAEQKCPALATHENGTWTGGWRTTVPGQMSV